MTKETHFHHLNHRKRNQWGYWSVVYDYSHCRPFLFKAAHTIFPPYCLHGFSSVVYSLESRENRTLRYFFWYSLHNSRKCRISSLSCCPSDREVLLDFLLIFRLSVFPVTTGAVKVILLFDFLSFRGPLSMSWKTSASLTACRKNDLKLFLRYAWASSRSDSILSWRRFSFTKGRTWLTDTFAFDSRNQAISWRNRHWYDNGIFHRWL